jgi:uncharacterized protein (TIGR04255 family)
MYEEFPLITSLEDYPEPFQALLFPFQVHPFTHGFQSKDGYTYVSVGPNQIRVNRIGPFQGFVAFIHTFTRVFKSFVERFSYQAVLGAQIKYVNKIEIPASTSEVSRLLKFYPAAPNLFENGFLMYHMVGHLIPIGYEGAIRLESADGPPNEVGVRTISLLVSALSLWDIAKAPSEVVPWIFAIQPKVVEAFEGCVTDEARAMFSSGEVSR